MPIKHAHLENSNLTGEPGKLLSVSRYPGINRNKSLFRCQYSTREIEPLRFHFSADSNGSVWVEDATCPSSREWLVNIETPISKRMKDYGIVARFVDKATLHPLIIASGIGESGAFAAAEVLTSNSQREELLKRLPKDWSKNNLEVVVATQVVDGKAGAPSIAAVHCW
jgi:hypothetical protein